MVSQFRVCVCVREKEPVRAVPLGEMLNSCMWFVFVYLTAAGPSLSQSGLTLSPPPHSTAIKAPTK